MARLFLGSVRSWSVLFGSLIRRISEEKFVGFSYILPVQSDVVLSKEPSR